MQVEGGAVDVHPFHQLLDGDFADALFLHQLRQPLSELGAGLSDAAIRLFGHRARLPFVKMLNKM